MGNGIVVPEDLHCTLDIRDNDRLVVAIFTLSLSAIGNSDNILITCSAVEG